MVYIRAALLCAVANGKGGSDIKEEMASIPKKRKEKKMHSSRISRVCLLALLISGCWPLCAGLSAQSGARDEHKENLVRFTILQADALIRRLDNDESDYLDQWRDLAAVIPLIESRELKAKAHLLRLLCMQRLIEIWFPMTDLSFEREAAINSFRKYLFYEVFESNRWFLKTDKFWELHDQFKDLPIAEDIAWEATMNFGPEYHRCEGYFSCILSALCKTTGNYLRLYPDGKHVPMALDSILSFCEKKYRGYPVRDDMQEAVKGDLLFLYQSLLTVLENNGAGYVKKTIEVFERRFGSYIRDNDEEPVKSVIEETADDNDEHRDFLQTIRGFLNSYDHRFEEYVNYWRELGSVIPSIHDRELEAEAKLLRFLCLMRSLRFGDNARLKPYEFSAWVEEVKDYLSSPGGGIVAVKWKMLWDLHEEYRDLPIADEIAWVAATNPINEYGPYFFIQIVNLNNDEANYLRLHPEGKYALLALEKISSFCRTVLGEDPLIIKPEQTAPHPQINDMLKNIQSAVRLSYERNSCRQAKEALHNFERAFGSWLGPFQ